MHEGEHQPQLALVARGILAIAAVQGEVEPFREGCDPRAVNAAAQATDISHHIPTAQTAPLGRLAGQVPDQPLDLERVGLAVEAKDLRPAPGGTDHVHEQADRCGLTGPIGAEVAEYLPRKDLQGEVEQSLRISVVLGQFRGADRDGQAHLSTGLANRSTARSGGCSRNRKELPFSVSFARPAGPGPGRDALDQGPRRASIRSPSWRRASPGPYFSTVTVGSRLRPSIGACPLVIRTTDAGRARR